MKLTSPHIAGIIPVAGQKLDYNFPWHDCLQPVASNFLAIEHAVVECAYAGCRTIWIVCHDDMQPLIRHRLGDYIQDPQKVVRARYQSRPSANRREISIFYVPIHPNDRFKRDCLSWSVIYGIYTAKKMCHALSKWLAPRRYFVTFPYGLYPITDIKANRSRIVSNQNVFFSHKDKTIIDDEYLPFTLCFEQAERFRKAIKKKGTGLYRKATGQTSHQFGIERLPIEERYSARFFSLSDVFDFDIKKDEKIEVEWYFNIDNWDNLCEYLGSEERKSVRRPPRSILHYHEFAPIGDDIE